MMRTLQLGQHQLGFVTGEPLLVYLCFAGDLRAEQARARCWVEASRSSDEALPSLEAGSYSPIHPALPLFRCCAAA